MDDETRNTRVFILTVDCADLVYSTETDTIFSVIASSSERQTQKYPHKL